MLPGLWSWRGLAGLVKQRSVTWSSSYQVSSVAVKVVPTVVPFTVSSSAPFSVSISMLFMMSSVAPFVVTTMDHFMVFTVANFNVPTSNSLTVFTLGCAAPSILVAVLSLQALVVPDTIPSTVAPTDTLVTLAPDHADTMALCVRHA